MSDDPAERLRRSNEITIHAVLEIGQSDEVEALTAVMGDVVRLPVRLEWIDAPSRPRGAGSEIRPKDAAPGGGAPGNDAPDGGAPAPRSPSAAPAPDIRPALDGSGDPVSSRPGQLRGGSGGAIAPIPSRPRRHRARFIFES